MRKKINYMTFAATNLSSVYGYNLANQRTGLTNADGSYWTYQYDSLGQMTNTVRRWSDGTLVAGEQFGYLFDTIGNRTQTLTGGDSSGNNLRSAAYSANNLNEYTSRTVPGYVEMQGSANTNATVTVNGSSAYRKGPYFRGEVSVANSNALVNAFVTNQAVLSSNTVTWTRHALVPGSPESLTHDLDGNLTTDGKWSYTWDAENRLISMQSISAVPAAAAEQFTFSYDYQGRRIYMQESVTNTTANNYRMVTQERYWYDGWNLIGRADLATTMVQTFVWGLDLSGTMQGASGVGGLQILDDQTGASYFYDYDGNGNVIGLTSAADGSLAVQYTYSAFGEIIEAIGPMAFQNPVCFQSEFYIWRAAKYYWKNRFYDPIRGGWLNNDPIQEQGGPNLRGFVDNDPINQIDPLGLYQYGGHFYTIYAVAIARGYSPKDAYALAYFGQLPDQVSGYSAYDSLRQWSSEITFDNQWLRDIQEVLHSLHGGDVLKRRDCLAKMLSDPQLKATDKGLLLHAFGDSFAHTYIDPKTQKLMAYSYPFGHRDEGSDPDLPSLRPGLYKDYVNAMFQSLPPGPLPQNQSLVGGIIQQNQDLSTLSNPFVAQDALVSYIIKQAAYQNAYRPEKGDYSSNPPTGVDDLGTLSRDRIQKLIDYIKKNCCNK